MRIYGIITRLIAVAGVWAAVDVAQTAYAVSTDRGAWNFDVNHTLGSSTFVGNDAKENTVIGVYNNYGIARSYDSFITPPNASDIAAWHVKLNANGITPMLLLSDAGTAYDPNFFQTQLIDFNNGRPANEQYAGVKLDLEPQASGAWNGADLSLAAAINRRDMLLDLAQTYTDIRAQLDTAGLTTTPIYADIPVWFDVLDGFIGWGEGTALTDEQERDNWFWAIDTELDGITLMAFSNSNLTTIKALTDWEVNNFPSDVRVALEASVGGGNTWPDGQAFLDAADELEDHYSGSGKTIGIDIQEFTQFFTAVQPEPITAVLSFMSMGALWASVRRRRLDETQR